MEQEKGKAAVGGEDKEQTLLLLTPFTTNAPVAGGDLADYLQEASPYRVSIPRPPGVVKRP